MKKIWLIVCLVLLIPLAVSAEDRLKNGYELYHTITLMDNPQTPDDVATGLYTTGYLAGYLDGLSLMQDLQFENMFPSKMLSEKERDSLAKQINFHRLNIPKGGLPTGQLMLIFKKFAEMHPEQLNGTARVCVFQALVEAYGWK